LWHPLFEDDEGFFADEDPPFMMIEGAEKIFFSFAPLHDGHRGLGLPARTRISQLFLQVAHSYS